MKYNLNINQYAVFSNPEFASLTLQDLVVFDFIKDFANTSACKRNSDGYFWIKHTIVSDALPILGVFNEETNTRKDICRAKISQIMRKLCKVGLLAASPDNEAKGISEYAFGANYDKMVFAKDAQKNSNPCKNLQPPYQKNTTPPCKNLQPYNSNNTNIDISNNVLSGDLQSPFENIKTADEKTKFSEWLNSNGFARLSKTNFFLNKEKSCAKKEKLGDVAYLATLDAIEKYLGDNPKYLDDKKAFPLIFDRFAVSPELIACKNDFNRVFSAKFNSKLALHGKAAETALNGIISQLNDLGGDMPTLQKITRFFDAIAKLPKFDNEEAWNPNYINSGFGIIISLLNNNKPQPSRVETFKERDERLAKEKEAERQLRQFEQEKIKAEKAQIQRFIERGDPLTPEMLQSAAYRELFGNGEAF